MTIQYAIPAQPVIRYDGTNSAEIVGMYGQFSATEASIASEEGGTLSLAVTVWEGGGNVVGAGSPIVMPLEIQAGDWVHVSQSPSSISAADFAQRWIIKPEAGE